MVLLKPRKSVFLAFFVYNYSFILPFKLDHDPIKRIGNLRR